jgi:hypothetical protein
MNLRTTRFSLLFLAFWIMGGQWLMLQSVAWVNMVRDYSQNQSLSQALKKTFDGNHPCPLCRYIQKEKAAQNSAKTIPVSLKNLFLPVPFAVLPIWFISRSLINSVSAFLPEPHLSFFSPPPETFPQS